MTYILLILITIPLAKLWNKRNTSQKEKIIDIGNYTLRIKPYVYALLAFLPLYIVYAFQCSVHSDYDNYQILYSLTSIGNHELRDPAVYLIFRILSNLRLPFQSVYIVIYFIAFFILAKCIKDYSVDFSMSMTLFITVFFMLGFYYIRQLLAVVIVFYAYRYINTGNFKKYLVLTILASTFHTSALIMLPGYFLLRYRFNTSFYVLITLISAIINAAKNTVLTWIVATFIPKYFGRHEMFRSFAFDLYDTIWILILMLITFIYIFKSSSPAMTANNTKTNQPDCNNVFLRGLIFYFILYFFGRWILEFERFGYYFYFPVICLYPKFIERLSQGENSKSFRTFLNLATYALLILLLFLKYNADTVWNYTSIFHFYLLQVSPYHM
ncbi:EpsG family protein [Oribacterium sp. KHPX15]|uniref:EpsG family protein n=1 Tax=Oribacterium sp. KHPX15 TaxID=1855342 RepID=UPI00089AC68B|nr:EpsG family protein [Oribacterium sp. KHPX15]SEA56800.1 EpsG family protein [Oribacterium sp. KHPX15]